MRRYRRITIGDYFLVGLLLTIICLPLTLPFWLKNVDWFVVIPVFGIGVIGCGFFLFVWYVSLFEEEHCK